MIRWQSKTPTEKRDYRHDWTPFLGSDTIVSETHSATGVTLEGVDVESGDQSVVFRVSGGTINTIATVTQTITSAGGRTESETFVLKISADEPVSLAVAKDNMRELSDWQDATIEGYIVAARRWVENYTGHILVQRDITETFHCFSDYLRLSYRPFVGVTEIAYTDSAGDAQTFADYTVAAGHYPLRIYPTSSWPDVQTYSAATVTYTAGYSVGEEPEELLQAILLLVGHWYRFRETGTEEVVTEIPFGVRSLCDQYRTPLA